MATNQPSLTTITSGQLVSTGPDILNTNFNALNQNASETIAGKVQVALSADSILGIDDTLMMTPLKVAQRLNATRYIWPAVDSTYDVGSTSLRYSQVFVKDNIDIDGDEVSVNGTSDNILINGIPIAVSGDFVKLTGDETVFGIKTFKNELRNEVGITLSAVNSFLVFDELGGGDSGITFKDNGVTIGSMLYDQSSEAIKVKTDNPFAYSWQFNTEVIFGTGTKTASDFTSGVADNGISASKIKRYKLNVNDDMTTVSGANVPVDWSDSPVFDLYLDEGESGHVIVAQNESDIYLPPLTRDGGATHSGGTLYTIVNMSNNNNVEIFGDVSLGETIAGSASLSNSTRFSTITLVGVYKREFGTGSKEGFWVIKSKEGTWS
jgi:hypothetical protein